MRKSDWSRKNIRFRQNVNNNNTLYFYCTRTFSGNTYAITDSQRKNCGWRRAYGIKTERSFSQARTGHCAMTQAPPLTNTHRRPLRIYDNLEWHP